MDINDHSHYAKDDVQHQPTKFQPLNTHERDVEASQDMMINSRNFEIEKNYKEGKEENTT